MCGVIGYISSDNLSLDNLSKQLKLIEHRGPDNNSEIKLQNKNLYVHLAHTRLSIIDVHESANQPFLSKCNDYLLVFNGEIYNHKDLKNKFLGEIEFKTESDTEVLLELFIKYKEKMLPLLDGMFAFTIYNKKKNELFVARDPLGIKPIYYYHDEETYVFSSEIKPLFTFPKIDKKVDAHFLEEFLWNGFLYEPDTGFKNIKKVHPGSYQRISLNEGRLTLNTEKFWTPGTVNSSTTFEDLLTTNIDQHLIADVPLGTFFSGGVDSTIIINKIPLDSTLITLKSNKKNIKTSGFSDDYIYAKEISKHLNRTLTEVTLNDGIGSNLLDEITHIASSVEEPIADYTFIASQKLSKVAREQGLIVMLSGMGADEIFAGYPRYSLVQYENLYSAILPFSPLLKRVNSLSKKIDRFVNYFNNDDFTLKYSSLVGYFSNDEISNLAKVRSREKYVSKLNTKLESYKDESPLKKAMLLDKDGFLSHNFIVGDKSSMLESIELRVPLATQSLFDYTFSLSDKKLLDARNTKLLLKKHLEKYIPKKLIYRKKAGFNPPLDNKIYRLGKNRILNFLKQNNIFEILNEKPVQNILDNHFAKKTNNTYKIYSLLFLSAWYNFATTSNDQ